MDSQKSFASISQPCNISDNWPNTNRPSASLKHTCLAFHPNIQRLCPAASYMLGRVRGVTALIYHCLKLQNLLPHPVPQLRRGSLRVKTLSCVPSGFILKCHVDYMLWSAGVNVLLELLRGTYCGNGSLKCNRFMVWLISSTQPCMQEVSADYTQA